MAMALPFLPPPNNAGVPLPPPPAHPPQLVDINNAINYINALSATEIHATADDLGAAEVYKTRLVMNYQGADDAAPAWAAQMQQNMQQNLTQLVAHELAHINKQLDELPILLGNCAKQPREPLQNPTLVHNGWAPELRPPNPRTRDELFSFTIEQCLACAENLGLPSLLPGALVQDRCRQIAVRLGILVG